MRFHPELEARGCNVKTVLCEIFEKIREIATVMAPSSPAPRPRFRLRRSAKKVHSSSFVKGAISAPRTRICDSPSSSSTKSEISIAVKKLTREMDVSNLGLTEARLVNSVHLCSKIANFSAALPRLFDEVTSVPPRHSCRAATDYATRL
jgi:hypothetical protein